jgi:hypothetical protein
MLGVPDVRSAGRDTHLGGQLQQVDLFFERVRGVVADDAVRPKASEHIALHRDGTPLQHGEADSSFKP